MNKQCLRIILFFIILQPGSVFAGEDCFAAYQSDLEKEAGAKVTSVYDAWGNNMANMIKSGHKSGIVIDSAGDYADGKIHVDGLGNVVVDKNANVGPIINQSEINNTTVIMNRKRY